MRRDMYGENELFRRVSREAEDATFGIQTLAPAEGSTLQRLHKDIERIFRVKIENLVIQCVVTAVAVVTANARPGTMLQQQIAQYTAVFLQETFFKVFSSARRHFALKRSS